MLRQIAAAVVGLLIGVFLFLQFRQSYQTTRRQDALEAQIQQFMAGRRAADAEVTQRLHALEVEVFGELPAVISKTERAVQRELHNPSGPERWQRNRDAELRTRVRALEYWRLRVEGQRDADRRPGPR